MTNEECLAKISEINSDYSGRIYNLNLERHGKIKHILDEWAVANAKYKIGQTLNYNERLWVIVRITGYKESQLKVNYFCQNGNREIPITESWIDNNPTRIIK